MLNVRVVVTGIGLVTALGNDFWEYVSQGVNGGYRVPGYNDGPGRFIELAKGAAEKAVFDSGLSSDLMEYAGVTISSSKGGLTFHMPNFLNVKGPVINSISACATGLNSIIMGCNFIKTGRAKVVLSGGAESCLSEFIVSGFKRLGVLSEDGVCRPYSKNRNGFVLSEGAGVVVLEELEHAVGRGAHLYGEITGNASLGDAYHITSMSPAGETLEKAIKICLKDSCAGVDYINTHGTGTIENDLIETKVIKRIFGRDVLLSSTKPVTGHMLGASGAAEFAICLLAMKNGFIPPTANLDEPDPLCDLDYTANIGRKKQINRFLKLSYGFGGHIACVEGRRI